MVEFKIETNNKVVNVRSTKGIEDECSLSLITFPTIGWLEELRAPYAIDEQLQSLISKL